MDVDSEVKSFIYQQLSDFSPYVTAETMVVVLSRNPKEDNPEVEDEDLQAKYKKLKHRIAIVLEEDGAKIEAEAYHNDIYEAIKLAKTSLLNKLADIRAEVESEERNELIKEYSSSPKVIH